MQGQPTDFNVWTREAGHGSLAILVEGPSKAIVDFKVLTHAIFSLWDTMILKIYLILSSRIGRTAPAT